MSSADLQPVLEAMEKPLRFASENEYAGLKNLKGLEPYFGHWLKKATALPLSPKQQDHFHRLSSLLAWFDPMDLPQKKAWILKLQGILEELKREDASPQDTPPAPAGPLLTLDDFREKQKLLKTPMQFIKGVGPHLSSIFKKKNILTVEDALYLLPRLYVDRRQIKKIAQTDVGQVETVMGTVLDAELTFMGRRRIFQVKIGDSTGVITAKWFHFNPRFMKGRFQKGMEVILSGEVRLFHFQKEMDHPELDILKGKDPERNLDDSLHYGRIIPIYSETEGLYQRQRLIRRIWKNAVDQFAPQAESGIPEDICRRQKLMPLPEALRKAHFPDGEDPIALLNEGRSPAHRRLVFDEFFFLELGLALRRSGTLMEKGISFPIAHRLTRRLRELLPFQFTPAQERVTAEIEADMRKPVPMNRLLQGDVGSGKTIVALMACLMAIEGGYQAALMAPTEILAEQHFLNIRPLLDSLGLRAILLTSSRKKSAREKTLKELAGYRFHLAIGTHALIQEGIHFKNLGLVIIDEQHKFGVIQRAALKRKGYQPDVLVMTATPIPRTLTMTLYGDLDVSLLDEKPPGRGKIITAARIAPKQTDVTKFVKDQIAGGRQAYLVYPIVEESETP
ncbi:MAG: ATP-dependent DNA helicase RecG, partial [Deltaproteobacteria bacterium]|nr:ATP-dependent DNA helicase RecG [Deltaproteobacteria bacterium]